jgi:hypothetical protein
VVARAQAGAGVCLRRRPIFEGCPFGTARWPRERGFHLVIDYDGPHALVSPCRRHTPARRDNGERLARISPRHCVAVISEGTAIDSS